MKKILVTGSAGFIAGHTIEELHRRGYFVVGIERHEAKEREMGDHRPDVVYFGDVRDKSLVDKVVAETKGVINLAGVLGTQETINNPMPSIESNIIGTVNVLDACKVWKVPCVQIAVGNHWMNNSYSITKTTAERLALMYRKEFSIPITVIRALNAFGERQKAFPVRKIMPSFIGRALRGEDIQVYGDGSQEMDMVYVGDVAMVLVDALERLFDILSL
jgi:nucleoside-diphosphate-sugar epimerase